MLDELVESYLANGYFPNEPVLVLPRGNRYVVVEGNRRTAALMRLLGTKVAEDADLVFELDDDDGDRRAKMSELSTIPAVALENREEVHAYLGFRHISGLKTWGAEAKARYLWLQVEAWADRGSSHPFFDVGRQVGSNASGVRTAYNAFNLIRSAQDLGLREQTAYVKTHRFGVWTRLLGTANVPAYLGIDVTAGNSYLAVKGRAEQLNLHKTSEVLADLRPKDGQRRAVLADSRDATDYSEVLGNARAHRVLREYENLALATQVIQQGRLGLRIQALIEQIEVLTAEVPRLDQPTESDVRLAGELRLLTRALEGVVVSSATEDSDDA